MTDYCESCDVTHFADIRLPQPAEKPDPYAELKAAHVDGKVIQYNCGSNSKPDWEVLTDPTFAGEPHEYRIKPTPETFEAHGKTWNVHNKGDTLPCDGDILVEVIDGDIILNPVKAQSWNWMSGNFRGWRYADEPTPEPWAPKVGNVVTLKSGGPKMTVTDFAITGSAVCHHFDGLKLQSSIFPTDCLQPA